MIRALEFLLVLFLANSARAGDLEDKVRYRAFVQMIEKEIGKNDAWVIDDIQVDYGTPSSRHVKLRRVSELALKQKKEMGFIGCIAAYNPISDEVLIPYRSKLDTADSISHELWHALYDDKEKLGLVHRPEFKGPSITEIEKFAKVKIAGPAFKKVIDAIVARRKVEEFKSSLALFNIQARGLIGAVAGLAQALKYRAKAKELELYIEPRAKHSLEGEIAKITPSLKSNQNLLRDIMQFTQDMGRRSKQMKDLQALVREFDTKISDFGRRIDLTKDFVKESRRLKLAITKAYEMAADKCFADEDRKRTAAILATRDPNVRKELQELQNLERMMHSMERMRDAGDSIDLTLIEGTITSFGTILVSTGNVIKLDEVFGDANEVMARIVNSAYSLYYGSVQQNRFPLS